MTAKLLALTFLALQISDFTTTRALVVKNPEVFYEANPIANAVLTTWGWPALLTLKMTVTTYVIVLAFAIRKKSPKGQKLLLGAATAIMTPVVIYGALLLTTT